MIERTDPEDPNGLIILQENTPDFAKGMLRGVWTFIFPDGSRKEKRVRTRMYLPHVIVSMLERCGFVDVKLYGSMQGEPLELSSPRCIVLGRRPT